MFTGPQNYLCIYIDFNLSLVLCLWLSSRPLFERPGHVSESTTFLLGHGSVSEMTLEFISRPQLQGNQRAEHLFTESCFLWEESHIKSNACTKIKLTVLVQWGANFNGERSTE